MLAFATGSFGDSGDPYREKMFTRTDSAEFLLDAGSAVEAAIWKGAIRARAKGVLQLLLRKGVLPRTLDVLAALGDIGGYVIVSSQQAPVAMSPPSRMRSFVPAVFGIRRSPLSFSAVASNSTPRSASEWRNGVDEAASSTTWPNIRSTEPPGGRSL